MVDKQPLIFPSLITAFCKEAGVDFRDNPFDSGIGPVDRATWNNQLRERDPSGVRVRTGRKKPTRGASTSKQVEEVPEQMGFRQDDMEAETIGCFTDVWDNLTDMREALSLPSYPRKKKRVAPFSPPSGGPTIDPEAAKLQAIMERSRKEHEERISRIRPQREGGPQFVPLKDFVGKEDKAEPSSKQLHKNKRKQYHGLDDPIKRRRNFFNASPSMRTTRHVRDRPDLSPPPLDETHSPLRHPSSGGT
ncbi:hypothetical protein LWI29_035411 [Acer saccharum]|uniref:Uncharacterized protein n=1 Tax=Acer saccharum TaxID=4024 RepID=A0AA39RMF6_ACESA|nr:hypothetical protein LWI29_035411 [Acer saccharum]